VKGEPDGSQISAMDSVIHRKKSANGFGEDLRQGNRVRIELKQSEIDYFQLCFTRIDSA
jgi:hypothetical protein